MLPRSSVVSFVLCLAATGVAQSGRTTRLSMPPMVGGTFQVQVHYPLAATGNLYGFLFSAPFAGSIPLPPAPPFTFVGSLRVDPFANLALGIGVYLGSGLESMAVTLPNTPSLVGASIDAQAIDLDGAQTFFLADTEASIVVSLPPNPALDMVAIAPGTFLMGSPQTLGTSPYYNTLREQPVHTVLISRPFWIGRHEVTQALYQAVVGSNPSFFQGAAYPNSAQMPVERVSWSDAVAFCAALTAQEQSLGQLPAGYVYRLPTEAEWEYCCRAGTTTEYHTGATLDCTQANFSYSYHTGTVCPSPGGVQTEVVGSYQPNPWGLHDMHGNVFEWCLDGWDGVPNYPSGQVTDPFVQSGFYRMVRGGGWSMSSSNARSAIRGGHFVSTQNSSFGFRVVCAPVVP